MLLPTQVGFCTAEQSYSKLRNEEINPDTCKPNQAWLRIRHSLRQPVVQQGTSEQSRLHQLEILYFEDSMHAGWFRKTYIINAI